MAELIKETKAQRAERLKREKNPWEHLDEIRQFAKQGFDSVPPEWLGTYLRWWGVYTQGDGAGVLGGKGGEGKSVPYFMARIRLTNGVLYSHQLRTIAALSERYGRGLADITVRQNFQLHWITIEALPELLDELFRCNLTTMAACGDDTRNVTGCPLAGIDADEICDASPLAFEATRYLVGNADFYNLPRKYKICLTGCRSWCAYPEINDIGLTALERVRDNRREIGFSLRVGGGLSSEPHLAKRLNVFIPPHQVLPVVRAASEIFRDSEVLRENRERARFKYLFLKHGWTEETFQRELQSRLEFPLEPAEPEVAPADVYRDHVGIHAQKQPGYCYVGASVLRGRLTSEQLKAVADLSDRFASGELRTTVMQNLVVVNVPAQKAEALAAEMEKIGLRVGASPFWRGTIACTGTEFCKLAITETKGFARWLVGELEDRMPGFDQHLKLHITGCPNGCGQHWIADVGLEGKKIKINGRMEDAYYFSLGGGVGLHSAITRLVNYRCAASEVPDAIERLLRSYWQERLPEENLRKFFARHSNEQLQGFLSGAKAEAPEPSSGLAAPALKV